MGGGKGVEQTTFTAHLKVNKLNKKPGRERETKNRAIFSIKKSASKKAAAEGGGRARTMKSA